MRFLKSLTAIFLAGLAHGQQPVEKTTASFYCFRYAPQLEDVYIRTGVESYQKIELSTANIIGPVAVVSADGAVTIHRMETTDKGETIYPLVGQAKTGSVTQPLIVLFPNAKDESLPYRALTLDRNRGRFPMGSYQFINLAPNPMRGLVGKTRVDVAPGTVKLLKPKGEPGEMLDVVFEYQSEGIWRSMTKTRWAVRNDRRSLMCAFLDPQDQRVKIRSIPERLVPAKPGP